MFSSIAIETSSQCDRRCVFCPNSVSPRSNIEEFMSMDLIEKVLDDLVAIGYRKRIELYIYNEPLRDRRLCDIIKMVRKMLPKSCIMISTNGDYMTPEEFRNMYNAGLNQLQINRYSIPWKVTKKIHAHRLEYAERSGIEIDGPIYQYISPKRRTMAISDKWDIEAMKKVKGAFALVNRAGNIPNFLPAKQVNKMCTKPFRFFNIMWNGEAMLCCNDYYNEVKIGNVADKSVLELWNSSVMIKYRRFLLEKDRSLSLCNRCDFNGGVYQWNVKLED